MRKMKQAVAVTVLASCLVVGVAAPGFAKETGWGCGGACAPVGH